MTIAMELFFMFFRIGLFAFGGGYAMVSVIGDELAGRGFMEAAEYMNVVAISQVTPGPLAVNVATYVGARLGESPLQSAAYSAAATLGVSLPSFILVLIIARFFVSFGESETVKRVLSGIRPSVIGLIAGAAITFSRLSLIDMEIFGAGEWLGALKPGAIIIAAGALLLNLKTKLSPLLVLLIAGAAGLVLIR